MPITPEEKDFIFEHRNDDVRKVALLGNRYPGVDMTFVLNQIAGWQAARKKLPSWAEHEDIIYPPHISMEQCSSEQTARYKASLAKGRTMVDLTGGFGVDFSFMSQQFEHATYVEQQEHLCSIAEHNFQSLGLDNVTVVCGESVGYLRGMDHVDVVYLDPARRDQHGAKTYAIEDCTPNVVELNDILLEKADTVIIKLSPMLDWHSAVKSLKNVTEVHIISVDNECKEMVLVVSGERRVERGEWREESGESNVESVVRNVVCVNIMRDTTMVDVFDSQDIPLSTLLSPLSTNQTLFVPNASIMKSGLFGQMCSRYGVSAIGRNSNLFIGPDASSLQNEEDKRAAFPGRTFRIFRTSTLNKRELREALTGITHANIAVRNFPLSVDQLRKRLKLKDGGDVYIFATTLADDSHILLFCNKE